MIIPIHKLLQSFTEDIALAEREILQQVEAIDDCTPIRVVFFTGTSDNGEYASQRERIKQTARELFGAAAPVTALVVQPPLEGTLIAEVTCVKEYDQITYHDDYILLDGNYLYSGGLYSALEKSIEEQSDEIFAHLAQILEQEELAINDIVRQWNYIEHITHISQHGQNYQQFNDSRSRFYALTTWENGYPAATGIGTSGSGVVIMVDAVRDSAHLSRAINNPLQLSAHAYSQQVLIEGKSQHKTTPKFERARWVGDSASGMIYISGTAAIRGEESLREDIVQQIIMTMENIEYLTSPKNQAENGVPWTAKYEYELLRIFVKRKEDWPKIKHWVEQNCRCKNVIPVLADICRAELLVEIGGIAKVAK